MSPIAPNEYDDLDPAPPWPSSRLYHTASSLTPRRALELREQIARFASAEPSPGGSKVYPSRQAIALPRASRRLFGARLDDALGRRRTQVGPFARAPLSTKDLGALLDLSVGVAPEASPPRRAYPSAGALYPLEIYVAALDCPPLERAFHHLDVGRHALANVAPCPPAAALARLILSDDLGDGAAAAIVITAVFARTQDKYGERGYRFALLEAGHAAQNLLLVAASLGLSAAPVGGFCEDALGAAMALDPAKESPIYVVLLGGRRP